MSPATEKYLQARAAAVDILTKFVTSELSALVAARRLMSVRFTLVGDALDDDWRTFVGIDSESDHLPLGEERRHWAPDALAQKDREIAGAEQHYRPFAMRSAQNLLRRYEEPNQAAQTTPGLRPSVSDL